MVSGTEKVAINLNVGLPSRSLLVATATEMAAPVASPRTNARSHESAQAPMRTRTTKPIVGSATTPKAEFLATGTVSIVRSSSRKLFEQLTVPPHHPEVVLGVLVALLHLDGVANARCLLREPQIALILHPGALGGVPPRGVRVARRTTRPCAHPTSLRMPISVAHLVRACEGSLRPPGTATAKTSSSPRVEPSDREWHLSPGRKRQGVQAGVCADDKRCR
jgi:hypothetical protein